jgi:hypothetical protein
VSSNINWDEALDKNGEVQEVQENVVVTQKGILEKDKFILRKDW